MKFSIIKQSCLSFFTKHDLLPDSPPPKRIKHFFPKNKTHWISVAALWLLFLTYFSFWVYGNRDMLFDPLLQNDDARGHLSSFHQYGPEGALSRDPIVKGMLGFIPPGLRLLYRVFVPLTNVYISTKMVQALCYLMVFFAGFILIRSDRVGLAGGLLLVFLVLHTAFMVNHIAGGLARAFAFPLFALWSAGAITKREWLRLSTAILGTLICPYAMTTVLGAEGFFILRDGMDLRSKILLGRFKRYIITVAICFFLILPYLQSNPIYTLEEARDNPVFSRQGRVPDASALPFEDPAIQMTIRWAIPFAPCGKSIIPTITKNYQGYYSTVALLFASIAGLLIIRRFSPPPNAAIAFGCAIVILYFISRLFAFRFYIPSRYYHYGMPMVPLMVIIEVLGLGWQNNTPERRAIHRNFLACSLIILLCLFAGDGIDSINGMTSNGRTNRELYSHIRKLPLDARITAHPQDADDITFWGQRASVIGIEALYPWFKDVWKRHKKIAEDTLTALYATDIEDVLDYCDQYQITHFLINQNRYNDNFKQAAHLFEPLDSFTHRIVSSSEIEDLIFSKIPEDSILFRHRSFMLVDVNKLRIAWTDR